MGFWRRERFGWLMEWIEWVDFLQGGNGCSSGCALMILALLGFAAFGIFRLLG